MTITVPDEQTRVVYTVGATPTTGPFNVPFHFLADDELVVYDVEADPDNPLLLTTDYTVQNAGQPDPIVRSITLVSSVTNTEIVIFRDIPIKSVTQLALTGKLNVESLNNVMLKIVMFLQQLETDLNTRTLIQAASATGSLQLPAPQANYALGWDSGGNLINLQEVPVGSLTTTPYGESVLAAADADANLTLLGVAAFVKTLLDDSDASTFLSTLGFTAFAKTLIDDPDAATVLGTLGFSDYVKNNLITPANAGAFLDALGFSTFGKSLVDDANADAGLATLGGGTKGIEWFKKANVSDLRDLLMEGGTRSISGATTLTATDAGKLVLANTGSSGFTVTLPAAASVGAGWFVDIKKTAAANTLTIDGNGAETIDGDTTVTLTNDNATIRVVSNGSNWHISPRQDISETGWIGHSSNPFSTTSGTAVTAGGLPSNWKELRITFAGVTLSGGILAARPNNSDTGLPGGVTIRIDDTTQTLLDGQGRIPLSIGLTEGEMTFFKEGGSDYSYRITLTGGGDACLGGGRISPASNITSIVIRSADGIATFTAGAFRVYWRF